MRAQLGRHNLALVACVLATLMLSPLRAEPPVVDPAVRANIEQHPAAERGTLYLEQAKIEQPRSLELAETWAGLALAQAQAGGDHELELDARLRLALLALLATRPDDAQPHLLASEGLVLDPKLRTREAEVLVLRGRWQIVTRRFDEAAASLARAEALAQQLGDRTSQADALHNQGLLAIRTGRQQEAQPLIEASLALNDADGREREADANRHYLGFIARDQGRYADALEFHRVVLEHGRARHDAQAIAHSANALGILYAQQEQNDEALSYFREAAGAYGTLGDRYSEAMAYINIGNTLEGDRNWREALPPLERGLEIAIGEGSVDAEILARAERAKVLLELDRPDEAEADARRAVELVDAGATSTRQHQATAALGRVLARKGDLAGAERMLERSVSASRESGRKSEQYEVQSELADVEFALGKHAEAFEHLEASTALFKEIRDAETTRKLAELRVQLETRQREAELAAQQQRIELLEQQAEQQSRIRLLMVAALLSSVLMTLALVSRFRTRQRAERELRAQNALIAKANADLAEAVDTDVLTGARNRRYFNRVLVPRLQAAQLDGIPHALALIDADRFKSINDHHGHDVGDVALLAIVRAWNSALGADDVLVRWGGEEFLAVLFDCPPAAVRQSVERGLAATREQEVLSAGLRIPVSVSVGWACGPWPGADARQLLALADRALLLAKAQGRDRGYGVHPGLDLGGATSPDQLLDLTGLPLDAVR